MKKPVVRYLVASPYGDVPVDNEKLDFPLEADPLKTPYRVYFRSISDFLLRDNCKPLLHSLAATLGREIDPNDINEIIVRTEKHGALYHPASIEVNCGEYRMKFGLNVAVTDTGKDSLKKEFALLAMLHEKFRLPYVPKPYYLDELDSMVFLVEEWFEGYHEFHLAKTEDGREKVKLWEYGKGSRFLSPQESAEIYRQASRILTLYYDMKGFRLIYPWHHAAGDFVVRITSNTNHHTPSVSKEGDIFNAFDTGNNQKNLPLEKGNLEGFSKGKIDIKLTAVRGYEPFMKSSDDEAINPVLALFYFLLHLSIQMRLDKLDGLGDVAWADDYCIDAVLTGFFEALKQKNDFRDYCDSGETFASLLKSFSKDDLRNTMTPVVEQFGHTKDFAVITANLDEHIGKLHLTLQNSPS